MSCKRLGNASSVATGSGGKPAARGSRASASAGSTVLVADSHAAALLAWQFAQRPRAPPDAVRRLPTLRAASRALLPWAWPMCQCLGCWSRLHSRHALLGSAALPPAAQNRPREGGA
eukprot:4092447-Lingulodinium_polyedra.AAC.2